MLVLSRKVGEKVRISDNVELVVVGIEGNRVRLGINAPREIKITRPELAEQPTKETNHGNDH